MRGKMALRPRSRCPFCFFLMLLTMFLTVSILPAGALAEPYKVEQLRNLVVTSPHDVSLWNALGIEQAKDGDLAGAVNTWVKGLDADPRYFHLYNNIGSALRRMGKMEEAAEWYRASLKIKPAYWTWYNLGLLYEDQGKQNEALEAFQAALRLFPGFFQAQEHLTKLEYEIARQNPTVPLERQAFVFEPITPEQLEGATKPPVGTLPLPGGQPGSSEKKTITVKSSHETLDPYGNAKKPTVPDRPFQPSPTVRQAGDNGGPVFITIDGGADADGIPAILSTLRGRQIHCTFFLTGQFVTNYPDLAVQILADGHEIANHSMAHKNMSSWDKEQIARELQLAEDAFRQVLGRPAIRYFRFPFGAKNERVDGIIRELGYNPVYWDIDTLDWKEPSVSSIFQKVRDKLKPYAVILMHCGSRSGPQALPMMLDEIVARGYHPTPLSNYDPRKIAAIGK